MHSPTPGVAFARRIPPFLGAVTVTALSGTIVQTQINLADILSLGAPVTFGDRLATTGADLIGFTPTLFGLAFVALLFALPAAGILARGRSLVARAALFALAGWVGLMAAFEVANAAAPMPTLIAATRGWAGATAVAASGALGAWAYAYWTRLLVLARVAKPVAGRAG